MVCHGDKGINVLLIFIPISWGLHFARDIVPNGSSILVFAFSFIAIIPLEKLSDFGGEQLALYLGPVGTFPLYHVTEHVNLRHIFCAVHW